MFDVGFSELLVCFLVALVVLGPQKLAGLARILGLWAGRAKAYVATLAAELERETGADTLRDLKQSARALSEEADAVGRELRGAVAPPRDPPKQP